MVQRWPNIPLGTVTVLAYMIDLQISTRIRLISQNLGTSKAVALMSLSLCLVEILMRLFAVYRLRNQMEATFRAGNFEQSFLLRRASAIIVPAGAVGIAGADIAATMLEQKKEYIRSVLDVYGSDMASDMLAEHTSMWITTTLLLMAHSFPEILNGPDTLSLEKIVTDFFIQLGFEIVADVVCIWIAYKAVGMSPMGIFRKVGEKKELWLGILAITMEVAAHSFSPKYECSFCSRWESDRCYGV